MIQNLLAELERLELEADVAGSEALSPVATLERIRQALDPHEAMLSFMVGPNTGESWLIAISRQGAQAYLLPARDELTDAVALWLGLVSRVGQYVSGRRCDGFRCRANG